MKSNWIVAASLVCTWCLACSHTSREATQGKTQVPRLASPNELQDVGLRNIALLRLKPAVDDDSGEEMPLGDAACPATAQLEALTAQQEASQTVGRKRFFGLRDAISRNMRAQLDLADHEVSRTGHSTGRGVIVSAVLHENVLALSVLTSGHVVPGADACATTGGFWPALSPSLAFTCESFVAGDFHRAPPTASNAGFSKLRHDWALLRLRARLTLPSLELRHALTRLVARLERAPLAADLSPAGPSERVALISGYRLGDNLYVSEGQLTADKLSGAYAEPGTLTYRPSQDTLQALPPDLKLPVAFAGFSGAPVYRMEEDGNYTLRGLLSGGNRYIRTDTQGECQESIATRYSQFGKLAGFISKRAPSDLHQLTSSGRRTFNRTLPSTQSWRFPTPSEETVGLQLDLCFEDVASHAEALTLSLETQDTLLLKTPIYLSEAATEKKNTVGCNGYQWQAFLPLNNAPGTLKLRVDKTGEACLYTGRVRGAVSLVRLPT